MEEEDPTVFVRFSTSLGEHAITDEKIAVPVKFRRLGLSQIVNHLLGTLGKALSSSTPHPSLPLHPHLPLFTPPSTDSQMNPSRSTF